MARSTRIFWARGLLLLLFLGSAGFIVYLLGFQSGEGPPDVAPTESPDQEVFDREGDFQVLSTGCRQAASQDGRRLFQLEAEECSIDRKGEARLTGVRVQLERAEGTYVVTGASGRYREEEQYVYLEGDVVVEGPKQLRVETDWLELTNQATILRAAENSTFRFLGTGQGTSRVMRIDLEDQILTMSGGVSIRSLPSAPSPFSLDAEFVTYESGTGLIRAQGGVRLTQDRNELEALRITVHLNDVGDAIRFVRALWDVQGTFYTQGDPLALRPGADTDEVVLPSASTGGGSAATGSEPESVTTMTGVSMALQYDDFGELEGFDLQGTRGNRVILESTTGPIQRRIRAAQLRGTLVQSALSRIEAGGGVAFVDLEDGQEIGRSRSQSASGTFDQAGRLVRLDMEGEVEILTPETEARAARSRSMVLQRVTELFGDPRVEVNSAQGLLTAPKVVVKEELGLVEATGGSRARIEDAEALGATAALGGGEGPVYVESQGEAILRDKEGTFSFKGDVRAWQGKNLLLTEQLRGDRDRDALHASGGVRTIWYPEEEAGGEQGEAVTIQAELMEYDGSRNVLVYDGSVRLEQQTGTMRCGRLEVELDEADEVQLMNCLGGDGRAELLDPANRREVRGDRMIYRPTTETLEVIGSVEGQEAGRKFSGPRFVYDLESGGLKTGSTPP